MAYSDNMILLGCLFALLVGGVTASPAKPDPEIAMNSTQLIAYNGYTPETYFATTNDGYILQMFRVKPKRGRI